MNSDSTNALKQAAALLKTGNTKDARSIIIEVLREEPENTQAWYMLSFAVPRQDKQMHALQQLLTIDPDHEKAKARLQKLGGELPTPTPDSSAETPPPKAAQTQTAQPPSSPEPAPSSADLLSQRLFGEPGETGATSDTAPQTASSDTYLPQDSFIDEEEPDTDETTGEEEKEPEKSFFGLNRKTFNLIIITAIFLGLAFMLLTIRNNLFGGSGNQADAGNQATATATSAPGTNPSGELATPVINLPTPTTPPPTPTPLPFSFNVSDLTPPDEGTLAEMLDIQDQIISIMGLTQDFPVDSYSIPESRLQSFVWDFEKLDGMEENVDQFQTFLTALGIAQPNEDYNSFYSNIWVDPNGTLFLPDKNLIVIFGFGISPYQSFSYAQAYVQYIRNAQYSFEGLSIYPPCNLTLQSCEVMMATIKGDAAVIARQWADANLSADEITKLDEGTKKIYFIPIQPASTLMEAIRLFPYQQGYAFASAIYQSGGINALNALYDNPPTTTEQILHPSAYLAGETAVEVESTNISSLVPSEYHELFTGSLGEWKTYLLLTYGINVSTRMMPEDAAVAAEGWGGDTFQIYTDSNDNNIIVGHWALDSLTDTQEFQDAIEHYAFSFVSGSPKEIEGYQCNQSNVAVACIAVKNSNVIWFLTPSEDIMQTLLLNYGFLVDEQG